MPGSVLNVILFHQASLLELNVDLFHQAKRQVWWKAVAGLPSVYHLKRQSSIACHLSWAETADCWSRLGLGCTLFDHTLWRGPKWQLGPSCPHSVRYCPSWDETQDMCICESVDATQLCPPATECVAASGGCCCCSTLHVSAAAHD